MNVFDLLELLACWGPVLPGCEAADLETDGTINVFDLLAMLGAWGPCPCTPDCAGKECGDDGCGGSCGSCASGDCIDGACVCVPDCTGKMCGDDGCGGSCGSCANQHWACQDGVCVIGEGACCFPQQDNQCQIRTLQNCESAIYLGHGTTCDSGFCPNLEVGSCVGHCGIQGYEAYCWCDSSCVSHGDCCSDACEVCGYCP